MAFCTKCGTNVPEGENFCPNCGAPVAPAGNTYNQQTAYVNPSDHTEEFSGEDINRTKYLAALGYISVIFPIIGLLSEPQSKFIRFHLNRCNCCRINVKTSSAARSMICEKCSPLPALCGSCVVP